MTRWSAYSIRKNINAHRPGFDPDHDAQYKPSYSRETGKKTKKIKYSMKKKI